MKLTLRYLIFVDTSLHVDGLSSLYVHSNLGLECVLDAYASYMQKMLDQLNPNKMFQNVDWLKPPALWEQKWKSSPTRTPGRVARRTQFFEKLNPKKSTIKMLVAEVKPCNHVVAWHIHLVKIHTSLQRKRNFEENNRLKEHDFSYQQRCMSSWMQLELGQTPPVNPACCCMLLHISEDVDSFCWHFHAIEGQSIRRMVLVQNTHQVQFPFEIPFGSNLTAYESPKYPKATRVSTSLLHHFAELWAMVSFASNPTVVGYPEAEKIDGSEECGPSALELSKLERETLHLREPSNLGMLEFELGHFWES